MRILVTGSGGKIGRQLVPELKKLGHFVVSLSRKAQPTSDLTIEVDWMSPSRFLIPEVDLVINLAGQTSAYVARRNRVEDVKNNFLNTQNLLESLVHHKKPIQFIQIGSLTEIQSHEPIKEGKIRKSHDTFYECEIGRAHV